VDFCDFSRESAVAARLSFRATGGDFRPEPKSNDGGVFMMILGGVFGNTGAPNLRHRGAMHVAFLVFS
jgi:hypothetical protein